MTFSKSLPASTQHRVSVVCCHSQSDGNKKMKQLVGAGTAAWCRNSSGSHHVQTSKARIMCRLRKPVLIVFLCSDPCARSLEARVPTSARWCVSR